MQATDSQEDGETVETELLTDTEFEQFDEHCMYPCPYRNPIQVRLVPNSPCPNYSYVAETLPTYSPIPGQRNYVLRVLYTHMIGPFTMDNCLKFSCELPAGKEYWRVPLESDPVQDLHYRYITGMAQEDLGANASAHSYIQFVNHQHIIPLSYWDSILINACQADPIFSRVRDTYNSGNTTQNGIICDTQKHHVRRFVTNIQECKLQIMDQNWV